MKGPLGSDLTLSIHQRSLRPTGQGSCTIRAHVHQFQSWCRPSVPGQGRQQALGHRGRGWSADSSWTTHGPSEPARRGVSRIGPAVRAGAPQSCVARRWERPWPTCSEGAATAQQTAPCTPHSLQLWFCPHAAAASQGLTFRHCLLAWRAGVVCAGLAPRVPAVELGQDTYTARAALLIWGEPASQQPARVSSFPRFSPDLHPQPAPGQEPALCPTQSPPARASPQHTWLADGGCDLTGPHWTGSRLGLPEGPHPPSHPVLPPPGPRDTSKAVHCPPQP